MRRAERDGSDRRDGGHRARGRSRIVRAVAELSMRVVAPTRERAIADERARVRRACEDGDRARQSADERRSIARFVRAVAELAFGVVAPASNGAVVGKRAGMLVADRDVRDLRDRRIL